MSVITYPDEHFTVKAKYRGENAELPGAKEALETLAAYERLMEATRKEVDAALGVQPEAKTHEISQIARLPKRDALAIAFQIIGNPATNRALYQFLKENGHPVASPSSMNTILKECHEFVSVKWGVWKYVPENRQVPGKARPGKIRRRQRKEGAM